MLRELEPFERNTLQSSAYFPGWEKATDLLESLAVSAGCTSAVDIGGGANPLLGAEFVQSRGIDYGLIDISQGELDKASGRYTAKICVDVTASSVQFLAAVGNRKFDLAFSHMFLEHVNDPRQVHRNIGSLLPPGGLAVHMYPSPNNLPLTLNRIFPEGLSALLLKLAQPGRDLEGKQGKFPAYYRMCGNRSPKLHRAFEELGYEVLVHCGFIGHNYYARIRIIDAMANAMAKPLARLGVGLTSFQLLVLRKA